MYYVFILFIYLFYYLCNILQNKRQYFLISINNTDIGSNLIGEKGHDGNGQESNPLDLHEWRAYPGFLQ